MGAPFVFGKLATKGDFTDRQDELDQLLQNFDSLINTILISPRRWGKTSLVTKAAELANKRDKSIRVCLIDLYNTRSEAEFYQQLAQEVLRIAYPKMNGLLESVKGLLGGLIPKISFSPDSNSEFKIGFEWQEVKKHPDAILDLAENIAKEKGVKFILCIDEFQNISGFPDPIAFQKKLRSHWQKHQNIAYCLYGSKRHMLMDVFTSPSMPFYKFGSVMFLQKIPVAKWIPFIKKRFKDTGKRIDKKNAELITKLVECHPYYVQQLAQQSWLRTQDICDEDIITQAFETLTLQLSLLFQSSTDLLSNTQVNLLKAISHDVEKLSSKDTIERYRLGTSANVIRIKKALINKEVLDFFDGKPTILDPVYKHWLKRYYFKD